MSSFDILLRTIPDNPPKRIRSFTAPHATQRGEACFINHIVLCELVWVLETAYRHSKAEVKDIIEKILMTDQFEIEERDHVWSALAKYDADRGDFSDYLIARKNAAAGCPRTVTFDRSVGDDPAFKLLSERR